jgi:TRAP-type mannitol/chloroaromatic compound transport system permease small subunit
MNAWARFARMLHATLRVAILLVLAIIVAEVLLRWLGYGRSVLRESAMALHAAVFLLGMAAALEQNEHVRVDVWSTRWTPRTRARMEFAGLLLLVGPVALFMLWISWPYLTHSFAMREASAQSDGLPAIWPVKALIPASALLLFLQALVCARERFAQAFPRDATVGPA